jgi:hypothetical protein
MVQARNDSNTVFARDSVRNEAKVKRKALLEVGNCGCE